jgi:hypothetical protein
MCILNSVLLAQPLIPQITLATSRRRTETMNLTLGVIGTK